MTVERHCIDCRHYQETLYPEAKQHCTALMGQLHPVSGRDVFTIDPGLMRMTLCGWRDPKFWEPKPKTEQKSTDSSERSRG